MVTVVAVSRATSQQKEEARTRRNVRHVPEDGRQAILKPGKKSQALKCAVLTMRAAIVGKDSSLSYPPWLIASHSSLW